MHPLKLQKLNHYQKGGILDMKHYMIVERIGEDDVSVWEVDLPESLFRPYETEGGSLRGPAEHVLEYIKERIVPVDERSCSEVQNQKPDGDWDMYAKMFYQKYANCWDYLHHTAAGGEAWKLFVEEQAPELRDTSRPSTILALPYRFFMQYMLFLHKLAAEANSVPVESFTYNDTAAIAAFIEGVTDGLTR